MTWSWAAVLGILVALVGSGQLRQGLAGTSRGDLFWDDFCQPSDKWQDLRAWGFGAWQVKDGAFVSKDTTTPELTMYAAAPRFAHAIVNRDCSVLFRYRPVAGSVYLFSINLRQHGWDCYKFEVDGRGAVRIVKARLGRVPEVLAESAEGVVNFGQWQWVRLDVRGDRPLLLRARVWQGALQEEPPWWALAACDHSPLASSQLGMTLNSLQQGGAYTVIDDFALCSRVPPSSLWQWAETKKAARARREFARGRLWAAEQLLKAEVNQGRATWEVYNNLGITAAERGDLPGALLWAEKAHALAPGHQALRVNLGLMWQLLAHGGLVAEASASRGLVIRPDRRVYAGNAPGHLRFWVLGPVYGGPGGDSLQVAIRDSAGQVLWTTLCARTSGVDPFVTGQVEFDPQILPDGAFTVVASAGKAQWSASFEVVTANFRALQGQVQALTERLERGRRGAIAPLHANDWANLQVQLVPLQRLMEQVEVPGLWRRQQAEIGALVARARVLAAAMERGENPWAHAVGTFLRGYYSAVDGSVQGYAVHVPAGYDGQRPFPLVINLHGYDPSFADWRDNPFLAGFIPEATEGGRFIVVQPFGRGNTMYQDMGEQDVLEVLAEVERLYWIDPDRICLTGGSMGGGGTWYIGLRHPDRFAALAPVMGPTDFRFWLGGNHERQPQVRQFLLARRSALPYAENAHALAIRCVHGAKDDVVPVQQSRTMVARLRQLGYPVVYEEYPEVAHGGFPSQMERARYAWLAEHVCTPWPRRVIYKTGDLNHPGAYWVRIDGFQNLVHFAQIEAEVAAADRIVVHTENVSRFQLQVPLGYCGAAETLQVVVDGKPVLYGRLPAGAQLHFVRGRHGDWLEDCTEGGRSKGKRAGLAGPVSDAFTGPFLLVYGTSGRSQENAATLAEAQAFASQWRRWQHAECRVKADRQVTTADIESFNLILIGGPHCNLMTERVNGELPIQFRRRGVQVSTRAFNGEEVGAVFVYPNPLNERRYVVVMGGVTWRGTAGITSRIGTEFDYVVFDDRTLGRHAVQGTLTVDGTPLLYGFFNQEWQLDPEYQWEGDADLRAKILPRTFVELPAEGAAEGRWYLSDLIPQQVDQWTGQPERDRTFWGTALQGGARKGIGVYPDSRLRFHLDGGWREFVARLCVDLLPAEQGGPRQTPAEQVQCAVYGDGEELFVSNLLSAKGRPLEVRVPVVGVRELELVVGTRTWLPGSPVAFSWVNARVEGR